MSGDLVAVTGASGFVGAHLLEHLLRSGQRVVAIGRTPIQNAGVTHRRWDLAEPIAPGLLADVDTVFHLAGRAHAMSESASDARQHDVLNRVATERLVEAAVAAGVRSFVYASTSKAAPGSDVEVGAYAASKWRAEQAVISASSSIHAAVARPVLVYGPGCKGNLVQLMRALDNGRMPRLPVVANRRSLVGIKDLVHAMGLMSSNRRAAGRVYVVTDAETYSTHRILNALSAGLRLDPARPSRIPAGVFYAAGRSGDLMQRVLRRRLPINSEVVDKLLGCAEFSCEPLQRELGYQPTLVLEDAATEMVLAYRATERPSQPVS